VLDYVFLEGDCQDPYYKVRREAAFLVSADCAEPKDVCFCTFCNGQPHPETGFDLNLSELDDGYVIQAGSDRGREFLEQHGLGLGDPSADQVKDLESRRERSEKQVAEQVQEIGLTKPESVQKDILRSAKAPLWAERAEACVECGACNFICPTCHCFLLSDLEEAGGFRRFKDWDSCQYVAFAQVAGGSNPRSRRADRFRNRFEKKFDFFAETLGRYACTGCGRCIEACAGKIDIRETLRDVANV
jgi:ferredoxin